MAETETNQEVVDQETVLTKEQEAVLNEEQEITEAVNQVVSPEAYSDPKYTFGRKVIRIPLSKNSLNEKNISSYLPYILNTHFMNVEQIKHLKGIYTGEDSNIWKKKREDSEETSNIFIEEGHPFRIVEFKKGYLYGEDVTYSFINDTACSDDLTYLNKFMEEQGRASKNVEIAEDFLTGGTGIRFILPKQKDAYFDPMKHSPFEIYNLDYYNAFIVYSSNYTKEKLFGGILTTIDSSDPNNVEYELMIYDHQYAYVYSIGGSSGGTLNHPMFKYKQRHYIGCCNFVEYKTNKSRISPIERVESLFDAANSISSYSIDNVIDFVNAILVIYNQDMKMSTYKKVMKNKAMILKTNDPNKQADAKYLVNALNLGDVQTKYDALVSLAYCICGVPLATTQSTSGGDTGDARELGGGWSNADNIAKQEEKGLIEAEKEMIDICLSICKKTPGCPVNELDSSDIKVVFNRSNRDNLLVKMQALKYAYDMNMPKEASLNIVGITSNSHEVAHEWEEIDKNKIQSVKDEIQNEPIEQGGE